MKKALFSFFLVLVCSASFAQSLFNTHLLNGDIKMQESFYEMALSYYKMAKAAASTPAEAAQADQKIRACERAMMPVAEPAPAASSKRKLLFSDQYLETGDIYDEAKQDVKPSPDETDYPLSLYHLEVYRDALVILSHEDPETSREVESVPAGTVLPLVEETQKYRRYASDKEGENFVVFKEIRGNSYGRYRIIYREQNHQYYVLYPMALVKKRMNEGQSSSAVGAPAKAKKENTEQSRAAKEESRPDSVKVHPITFTDNWLLNMDENGERIGDSRTEPLKAREICWLMFRFRYSCPYSFNETIQFDFKLIDPLGNLVVFPGKGTKTGYTASQVLETIPGGGIFNIVLGADTPGAFQKGRYKLSLWNDNVEYYAVVIELE